MAEQKTSKECACTYPGCPRHGKCEECKAYHHPAGEKTACERKNS